MKRLTIITATVLLAGCTFTPTPEPLSVSPVAIVTVAAKVDVLNTVVTNKLALDQSNLLWNHKIPAMLKQLKHRVGKTWYVYSGSTPAGWDCSGLVMWAYKRLGVDVPHSATAQGRLGKPTKHPRPGDIVVWGYGNFYFHSAIYYSDGWAIHVGRKGERTSFIKVSGKGFYGSTVSFVRVLPNPIKPVN